MRAVVLHEYGGPDVLTLEEVADPVPGPDEVLIDIAATALNRADLLQRKGLYPDPRRAQPEILGLEFAGVVAAIGPRVRLWKPGDRVMGIEAGGAYAEKIAVHERQLLAVPENLELADAAAIPEVFLTAWDALVVQGGLTSGRWALVHAGASGVGTAAIQIAKAIGANIAVTCSPGKAELCLSLGADLVLKRSPHDWLVDALASMPDGFSTILDVVGGEEIDRNLQVVAQRGTIVQVGLMAGGSVQVNASLLMSKRAHWVGTMLRSRPIEEKVALTRRFAAEMLPLFDDGRSPLAACRDRRGPPRDGEQCQRRQDRDCCLAVDAHAQRVVTGRSIRVGTRPLFCLRFAGAVGGAHLDDVIARFRVPLVEPLAPGVVADVGGKFCFLPLSLVDSHFNLFDAALLCPCHAGDDVLTRCSRGPTRCRSHDIDAGLSLDRGVA